MTKLSNAPFWRALVDICDETDAAPYIVLRDEDVKLLDGEHWGPPLKAGDHFTFKVREETPEFWSHLLIDRIQWGDEVCEQDAAALWKGVLILRDKLVEEYKRRGEPPWTPEQIPNLKP